MSIPKVSIGQVKAARALLGWSQAYLASVSGVSEPTIKRLEAQEDDPGAMLGGREETISAIRTALEQAGIQFLDHGDVAAGKGVALK